MRSLWPASLLLLCLPALAAAQPAIVSVIPNSAARGAAVAVQITGSETLFQQDSEVTSIVWLSQGASRIDASNVAVTSPTLLDANLSIPSDASTGLWDVNVQQVDSTVVTLLNGFTILSGCAISDLAAGTQTACDPLTNTYTQVVIVTYSGAPASGNLVLNGQAFAIGTSPQSVTLTGLVSNGAPVDVTASFSAETGCSRAETTLFTAPAGCTVSPCSISDLAAGTQSACNPETNTYTQAVVVTYANPPATGDLIVNGQSFGIGTSPQTVTLTGLVSNGAPVNVTANFSAESGCSRTESPLFTAPSSCAVTPCSISDLAAGVQTPCVPATNTYTQVVVVTFTNPPASGNLVVNGQSFAIGTSPQSVTLTGLVSNGAPVNVTANFSAESGCSRTESPLFTAPGSCAVSSCAISDLDAGAQTPCDAATNTYTQVVVVTYTNPPASGNLVVNGQSFAIGTSPQSVTLTGLVSNGAPVNVTAHFSADSGCSRTESSLFTAPASCGKGNPPDCSRAEPSREVLCSNNHRFKNVRIKHIRGVNRGDVAITITGVTSDEPVDGSGDGRTCPDAVIRDDGTVDLRAERSSEGNGRVYSIAFTATDNSGASCSDTVFVCVPRDRHHDDDDDDDDDDDGHGHGRKPGDGDTGGSDAGDLNRGGDHDRDGDHDGRHGDRDDDNDCGRRRDRNCVRDAVQYDATVCNTPKPSLSESNAKPLVTRLAGGQVAILFTQAATGPVDLRIFDLRGRLVRVLAAQDVPAGSHTLRWDGRDANGHATASGIYLVRLSMGGNVHTSKTVWMH